MKMTDESITLNVEYLPSSATSSPVKGGALSSGSEGLEGEWASCAGELERGTISDSSPQQSKSNLQSHSQFAMEADGIQTRSGLFQQLEREANKDSDIEICLEDRNTIPMYELETNIRNGEGKELSAVIPDNTGVSVEGAVVPLPQSNEKDDSFQCLRNKSYQKAVMKKDTRPKSVPYITQETDPSKEDQDDITKHSKILSLDSSKKYISTNAAGNANNLSVLVSTSNDTPSSSISRSVSFNDRLLGSPKKECSQQEPKGKESLSSPSTPCSTMKSMVKTRETVQIKSKPCVSNFERGQSPSDFQRKRSIKNITTSLAKRLSFRKQKTVVQVPVDDTPLDVQLVNGLPFSEGIVSYQGLLRLFECPGCNSLMLPPLPQCIKGHLVCEKCKITFKSTCPLCKQRMPGTTNYMMEQVCQLVKFPCQFGNYGCPEYHPPKQKTDHEHFCAFRPVYCHYATLGCEFVLSMKEMSTHMNNCQFKPRDKTF